MSPWRGANGRDGGLAGDASRVGDASSAAPEVGTGPGDAWVTRACGTTGQFCCSGDTCAAGGCCVDGTCTAAGSSCAHDLGTCAAGSCGTCGGLGQPCCQEASSTPECTAPGTLCDFVNTKICVACGQEKQPCCDYGGDTCLTSHMVCLLTDAGGSMCTSACGGTDQPCCTSHVCDNGGCCLNDDRPGTCVGSPTCGCTAGACTTCGAEGLPCCADEVCAVGTCTPTVDGGNACTVRQGP